MAKKKDQLEQRVADLENQLKRAVADYHNLEKRVSEGRSELTKWGTNELIKKLLPVMDNLFTAIAGAHKIGVSSGWLQGARLAALEFKKILEEEGLEVIPADPFTEFDPKIHEAVDTREGENGKIIDCVRMGYKLNGSLLRPAQVIVGKKNPPSMEETQNLPGGETQSDFHIPPKGEETVSS